MKLFRLSIIMLLFVFVTLTSAQIPRTLSYQGVLTDSLGNPKPDNSYNLTFRLYDVMNGGIVLWSETKSLQVKRGLFSTILGDQQPMPDSLTFDHPYWLSLQVGTEAELSPRIPLTAVGYSLYSIKSDTAKFAITAPQQLFVDSARVAGMIPNNIVTSAKIVNGTIKREDIETGFVAPKADTASYALSAPQTSFVDSARISSTVPNSSITSQKILDGTIQRVDVVPTFAAPYADTAAVAITALSSAPAGAAGGDLNGTYPNPTVKGLQGRSVASKVPTDKQILKWSNTNNWWEPANDSTGSGISLLGTINYITKFTGATTGGNSQIFDNGMNIGIGLTSPNTKLQVHSTSGAGNLQLTSASTGTAATDGFVITNDGGQHVSLIQQENADITFGVNNGSFNLVNLVLKPGGNIGIGTLTPNAPLGFPPSLGKKITLYPGATGDVGFGVAGNRLQIYSDNSNADVALGFDSAGTFNERFAVKANGALAVNGNTGTAGQVLQSNGNSVAAQWQTLASNPWQFNGSDVYYNGGRVGIGTIPTIADGVLDVSGRMRIRSGGNLATSAGLWLNNVDNTSLSAFVGMENDSSVGFYGYNGTGWSLGMNTRTGDIKMFGKLGIGTATPNAPLSFPPWAGKKITLYPGPFGDAGFGVFANELRINSDYSGADITFGYDDNTLGFTERMRIKGNGYVGIGTTTPNAPLGFPPTLGKKITLYPGPSGDHGIGVAGNRMQIYADNPNADVAIGYDAAGTFNERFAVKPNSALAVNGNTGTSGQVLTSEGSSSPAHWETLGNIIQTSYHNTSQSSPTLTNNTSFVFDQHAFAFTVTKDSRLIITFNFEVWSIFCIGCGSSLDRYIMRINGVDVKVFNYFNTPNGISLTSSIANYMYDVGPGTYTLDFKIDHSSGTDVWGYITSSSMMILPR